MESTEANVENKYGGTAAEASHYQVLSTQPIEIMQRLFTKKEMLGFLHGNIIKYALRCGLKGSGINDNPSKEMEKLIQYAKWYIQVWNDKTINPRK